jgi:hypothetical protein
LRIVSQIIAISELSSEVWLQFVSSLVDAGLAWAMSFAYHRLRTL